MTDLPILPDRLIPGSTIGIVAPSGALPDRDIFFSGIKILEEMGFKTKFPRALWPGDSFLADSDKNRVKEFQQLWCDDEVDAIMAARGGYGCLRILPFLETELLRVHKKLFIGYSDISCLHSLLNTSCNLATLHGPVVTSLPSLTQESLEQFYSILIHGLAKYEFRDTIEVLRKKDRVIGVATGGNLSTIVSLIGTPHQPDWRDKIVFLEDTGESAYKVDRMFTQLFLSGMMTDVGAFVLGDFSAGLSLDNNGKLRHREHIWQRILEITRDSTCVWGNFPMGHCPRNLTFPLGATLQLCSDSATIKIVL